MKRFLLTLFFLNLLTSQLSHLDQNQFRLGLNPLISSIGFGSNLNLEYGLFDQIGIKFNIGSNQYEAETETWDILPIDFWVTYHSSFSLLGDSSYLLFGMSQTFMKVENVSTQNIKKDSKIFLSLAYGMRFDLGDNFTGFGEARYRNGNFNVKGSTLDIQWTSIAAGVTYDLN